MVGLVGCWGAVGLRVGYSTRMLITCGILVTVEHCVGITYGAYNFNDYRISLTRYLKLYTILSFKYNRQSDKYCARKRALVLYSTGTVGSRYRRT